MQIRRQSFDFGHGLGCKAAKWLSVWATRAVSLTKSGWAQPRTTLGRWRRMRQDYQKLRRFGAARADFRESITDCCASLPVAARHGRVFVELAGLKPSWATCWWSSATTNRHSYTRPGLGVAKQDWRHSVAIPLVDTQVASAHSQFKHNAASPWSGTTTLVSDGLYISKVVQPSR